MWDGRSRTATGRARGSCGVQAALSPQTRKLGAVRPSEAARLAHIESLRERRSAPSASLILFGSAFICLLAVSLLLVPARGGAILSGEPEIASLVPSPAPHDAPSWTRIPHPVPLFTLDVAELSKAQMSYEAMRSTFDEGREDRLVFGSAARPDEAASFFVELSRRAAAAGAAVAKAAPGEPMRSKFGEMESAEAKLSMNEVERSCLAFRRAVPGEALRLLGWYCPSEGARVRAPELSCLIERLELSGATDDKTLRDAFATAQARRLGCGKPAPLAASSSSGKSQTMIAASAASLAPLLEGKPPRPRGTKTRRRRIP